MIKRFWLHELLKILEIHIQIILAIPIIPEGLEIPDVQKIKEALDHWNIRTALEIQEVPEIPEIIGTLEIPEIKKIPDIMMIMEIPAIH